MALAIPASGRDSPVQTDDPDPEHSDSAGQSDDGANPDTAAGFNGFDSDTGDPGDDAARAELGAVAISFRHPAQARTAFPTADVSSVSASTFRRLGRNPPPRPGAVHPTPPP